MFIPPRSFCVLVIKTNKLINYDVIAINKQHVNEKVTIVNSQSPLYKN
jgi:hypothetical protein